MTDFWWVTIPARLRRYSLLLWTTWTDGLYLTAWPRVAMALVLAIFVFGFTEGATHWSFRTIVGTNGFAGNVLAAAATADSWGGPTRLIFADNVLLLVIAVAAGTLSANLGLTLVIGFVLGDFLHGLPATGPGWRTIDPFNAWLYRHVPVVTTYVLFFLLASLPVLMAMELARSSHPRVARSNALAVCLTAIIEAALVYCWGAVAPMVFRTVQLWSGGVPRITVPFYSHIVLVWLVPTSIAAVLVRGAVASVALKQRSLHLRAQSIAADALRVERRTPAWLRAVIAAALVTLLSAGFFHTPDNSVGNPFRNYLEAEIVFCALAIALVIWLYRLPRVDAWRRWSATVEQYPAVLRVAAATAASYVLCLVLASSSLQSTGPGEFGPEVAVILVGLGLMLVLLPRGWLGLPPASRVAPWRRLPVPSRATQAAMIVAAIALFSKEALADCFDKLCCFAGAAGAAAAAAAGAGPLLGGIAGAAGAAGVAGALGGENAPPSSSTDSNQPDPVMSAVKSQLWKGGGAAAGGLAGGLVAGPFGAAVGGLIGGVAGAYDDAYTKANVVDPTGVLTHRRGEKPGGGAPYM